MSRWLDVDVACWGFPVDWGLDWRNRAAFQEESSELQLQAPGFSDISVWKKLRKCQHSLIGWEMSRGILLVRYVTIWWYLPDLTGFLCSLLGWLASHRWCLQWNFQKWEAESHFRYRLWATLAGWYWQTLREGSQQMFCDLVCSCFIVGSGDFDTASCFVLWWANDWFGNWAAGLLRIFWSSGVTWKH